MPPEVNVATNPLIVYGMVALFGVAIVLAFVFSRPRRGLGAVKPSDVPRHMPDGQPWMPGGDILGRDPGPDPDPSAIGNEVLPAADPWQSAPSPPGSPPAVHDAWSTGAADKAPQPRWDKR
jgi:hypothetical protein